MQVDLGEDEFIFEEPVSDLIEQLLIKETLTFEASAPNAGKNLSNSKPQVAAPQSNSPRQYQTKKPDRPARKRPDFKLEAPAVKEAIDKKSAIFTSVSPSPKDEFWSKINSIETLHTVIRETSFYQNKKNKVVDGQGPKDCDLAIIGFMPSLEDTELKTVFCGEAGDLLKKMMGAINVDFNHCYRTFLVKAPITNKIMPRIMASHVKTLIKEIELVKPKQILLMGEFTTLALNKTKIMTTPKNIRFADTPTMVTYDPVFLLKNPGMKGITWKHLQALEILLKKL